MPNLRDQLATAASRQEPDGQPTFDSLVAERRHRNRRRAAAAGGLAVVILAGTATLVASSLIGGEPNGDALVPATSPTVPDEQQPEPTGAEDPDSAICPPPPRYVPNPNGDGSLIDSQPEDVRTGMPDAAWDAVVAEAPFPPAGPKPATDDAPPTAFGSYKPTQHGYVTNTAVPLPPTAPMFTVWGQTTPCADLASKSVLDNIVEPEGIEGPAQGWAEGAEAGIIDRTPSYYQIVLVQNDATIMFMNENMETPGASDDLYAWAKRVSHRLAAGTDPGTVSKAPEQGDGQGEIRSVPYRVASVSNDREVVEVVAMVSPCAESRDPVVTETPGGLRVDVRVFGPSLCRASLVPLQLTVRLPRPLGPAEEILGQCTPGETTVEARQCPRDVGATN